MKARLIGIGKKPILKTTQPYILGIGLGQYFMVVILMLVKQLTMLKIMTRFGLKIM